MALQGIIYYGKEQQQSKKQSIGIIQTVDSPPLWSIGKLPNPDKQKTIKSSARQVQVPVRIWTKLQESQLQPV